MTATNGAARTRVPKLNAVVVTTKGAVVVRGALKRMAADAMILTNAAIASRDTNNQHFWQQMDGEVIIPIDNVEYYQSALDAAALGIE